MTDEPKGEVKDVSVAFRGSAKMTAEATVLSPMPEYDPTYALIGRAMAAAALLEHELDRIIWDAMDVAPRVGACITSVLVGPGVRIDILKAICRERRDDTAREGLTQLDGRMKDLANRRNRIAHDMWKIDRDTGQAHQFRSLPRGQTPAWGYVPVEEGEMHRFIAEAEQIRLALLKIEFAHRSTQGSTP